MNLSDWQNKLPNEPTTKRIINIFIDILFNYNEHQCLDLINSTSQIINNCLVHTTIVSDDIYIFVTSINLKNDLIYDIKTHLTSNNPIAYTVLKYKKLNYNNKEYGIRVSAYGVYCHLLSRAILNNNYKNNNAISWS